MLFNYIFVVRFHYAREINGLSEQFVRIVRGFGTHVRPSRHPFLGLTALFALGLLIVRTIAAPRAVPRTSPSSAASFAVAVRASYVAPGRWQLRNDSRPLKNENEEEVMIRSRGIMWACCVSSTLLLCANTASGQAVAPDAEGFFIATPEDLKPPDGGRSTVILGNPREPGPYVIRITFGPGQGSRPHFHDQARHITVIKGTWWVSTGARADVYDPDYMRPVEVGTFIYEPPYGHHYDMAKDEEVTVQIMGIGPVVTTSLD